MTDKPIRLHDAARRLCNHIRALQGCYSTHPISSLVETIEQLAANNGWQPIETAPHDGEHILVRTSDETIWLVYSQGDGSLFHAHDGTAFDYDDVTHWHSLPHPPNVKP